jgi:hypothetical protein
MQSGLYFGYIGLVTNTIREIRKGWAGSRSWPRAGSAARSRQAPGIEA